MSFVVFHEIRHSSAVRRELKVNILGDASGDLLVILNGRFDVIPKELTELSHYLFGSKLGPVRIQRVTHW
jgi:hypothetical protein